MRILLDECVHAGVRAAFPGHSVRTVTETGWRSSKDGPLLAFAEREFDIFVTIDRKLAHQHNLATLKLGVVLVRVRDNTLASYQPVFSQLESAVEKVRPGELVKVEATSR